MYTSSGWLGDMNGSVSPTIDDTFGEAVRLIPTTSRPNFQPKQQPEHAVDLVAVFSWRSSMVLKTESHAMSGPKGIVETRQPIFTFSRDALPWAIQQGDVIERCCSGEQFEAKNVEPDGVSRVAVPCVQLGRSSQ